MSKNTFEYQTTGQALEAAIQWLAQDCPPRAKKQLIVRSHNQVLHAKRELARSVQTLGINATTFSSWLTDTWELLGDGRRLVDANERTILLMATYETDEEKPIKGGYLNIASRIAREALPFIHKTDGLDPMQVALCTHLQFYADTLDNLGLCEPSQAYDYLLRSAEFTDSTALALVDFLPCDITALQSQVIDALPSAYFNNVGPTDAAVPVNDDDVVSPELKRLYSLLFHATGDNPVQATGALKVVLPTGLAAQDRAIEDAVLAAAQDNQYSIAVACKDPLKLFDALAPSLADAGISSTARGMLPFARTFIGRAFLALTDLFSKSRIDVPEITDYAFDPLANMSTRNAFICNKEWRGNRLVDVDDVASQLDMRPWEAEFQGLTSIFQTEGPLAWLDTVDPLLDKLKGLSYADKAFERADGATLRSILESASAHAIGVESLCSLLKDTQTSRNVHMQADATGAQSATVIFDTLETLGQMPEASFDVVILCQQNSIDAPIRPKDDARTLLYESWGIPVIQQPLQKAHRAYRGAIAAARNSVVLERCLNDEKADPLYPGALFEETMDCYRACLTSNDDLNEDLHVPLQLMPFSSIPDESTLFRNATGKEVQETTEAPAPLVGLIKQESIDLLGPKTDDSSSAGFRLSPSQIESYLECPYQWFAKRRLKLGVPDEGFSNLERGSFLHALLERFINAWLDSHPNTGIMPDDIPEAQVLLERIFDECVTEQPSRNPGYRYVPLNSWEKSQQKDILRSVSTYLYSEAQLLPGFHPAYTEWGYGNDAKRPVRYADNPIIGVVDRIDINDKGQAVVIDYKSSLNTDYRLYETKPENDTAFVLPRKMQALVYAKVVEEQLGVQVVGALYINPLAKESSTAIQGAFDPQVLGPQDLLGIDEDYCMLRTCHGPTFHDLLETTENMVQDRISGLACGSIAPHPISKQACTWCPVCLCAERME